MWLAPLLLTAVMNSNEGVGAEKAFQQMSDKVTKAKTFECTFEVIVEGAKARGTSKGSMAVADGNKLRLELEGEHGGRPMSLLIVSDGKKSATVSAKHAMPAAEARKDLAEGVLHSMTRGGVFVPLAFLLRATPKEGGKPAGFDVDAVLKVSDFKLGKKDRIDGKDTQEIEYTLAAGAAGEKKKLLRCTVWVDTKTQLPVKRVLMGEEDSQAFSITERYSKVVIDGKLEAKKFDLPK